MTDRRKTPDRLDMLILDTLQREGRIANVELAGRINLSPSPCLERVKRLEAAGIIEGYGARLDAAALGFGTMAFIQVTLDRTTADVFDQFRDAVVLIPEVAECHMVAGGFDYLLKLRLRDMEAYRQVLAAIVGLPRRGPDPHLCGDRAGQAGSGPTPVLVTAPGAGGKDGSDLGTAPRVVLLGLGLRR